MRTPFPCRLDVVGEARDAFQNLRMALLEEIAHLAERDLRLREQADLLVVVKMRELVVEAGRRRFLVNREDARVLAQDAVDGEHLRLGDFPVGDDVGAFLRGEEVEDVEVLEHLLADAVDSPDALYDAGGVPRDVVVDDQPRTVQVEAFGKLVGRDQDVVVVCLTLERGVEVALDLDRHLTPERRAAYDQYAAGECLLYELFDMGHGVLET